MKFTKHQTNMARALFLEACLIHQDLRFDAVYNPQDFVDCVNEMHFGGAYNPLSVKYQAEFYEGGIRGFYASIYPPKEFKPKRKVKDRFWFMPISAFLYRGKGRVDMAVGYYSPSDVGPYSPNSALITQEKHVILNGLFDNGYSRSIAAKYGLKILGA